MTYIGGKKENVSASDSLPYRYSQADHVICHITLRMIVKQQYQRQKMMQPDYDLV
jgi:hypothetical protein